MTEPPSPHRASRRHPRAGCIDRHGGPRLCLVLVGATATATAAAASPGGAASGGSGGTFLLALLALLVVGRLLGELLVRLGQPAVMGPLFGGALLGPSVLGTFAPRVSQALFPTLPAQHAMLDALAQLGLVLMLLVTGMDTDLSRVARARRAAVWVSALGMAVPFLAGSALALALPRDLAAAPGSRLATAAFIGVTLAVSSVKIVAMVVRDLGFADRRVGQVILASAVIDDTVGWVTLSLVLALSGRHALDAPRLLLATVGTAALVAYALGPGRRAVYRLIRFANDSGRSEGVVVSTILALTLGTALLTNGLGVHTVLGAFLAGMLVGDSPILTGRIGEELRGLIVALFTPVVFGLAGLEMDLKSLAHPSTLAWLGAFIACATLGKFGGALAGGALAGLPLREALAIGCGMNARGSTEVVVATLGLSLGVITPSVFTLIVATAVLTTLAMPPTLRFALARVPLNDEERADREREATEDRSALAPLERLLLLADPSGSGAFAATLGGALAVRLGAPVTLVPVGSGTFEARLEASIAESARRATDGDAANGDVAGPATDVTARPATTDVAESVTRASAQGHDLLLVGLEPLRGAEGRLNPAIADALATFSGPVVLAVCPPSGSARSDWRARLRGMRPRRDRPAPEAAYLIAVSDSSYSRRAAEIALVLAANADARAVLLHVADRGEGEEGRRARVRRAEALHAEMQVFARHHGARMEWRVVWGHPSRAVSRALRRETFALGVLGVARGPGTDASFGAVPDAVLERPPCPLLLVVGD